MNIGLYLLPLLCSTALPHLAIAADTDDGAQDEFQVSALFEPSDAQFRAEAQGRVMIYDGLDEDVVEHALEEEFDRLEHVILSTSDASSRMAASLLTTTVRESL
jgi:hypothetical protein